MEPLIVRQRARIVAAALLGLTAPLPAQTGTIGVIEVYGMRAVSSEAVRSALGVKPGDPAPADGDALRQRLLRIPGVADAQASIVCCENGRSMLYAGIRETADSVPAAGPAPSDIVPLPDEVVRAESDFTAALQEAVERGQAEEDHAAGHALMRYPPARAVQLRFVALAGMYEARLRETLAKSRFPLQRALAAQVLAYLPDKARAADLMVSALADPSPAVRNDAARALWVIADYARERPAIRERIAPEPLIAMMNSVAWTDRNKASLVLMELTSARDSALLAAIDRGARESLENMAGWRTQHALPAFVILGRVRGMPEEEIFAAWRSGDRSRMLP